jgi:hypothetical protein
LFFVQSGGQINRVILAATADRFDFVQLRFLHTKLPFWAGRLGPLRSALNVAAKQIDICFNGLPTEVIYYCYMDY